MKSGSLKGCLRKTFIVYGLFKKALQERLKHFSDQLLQIF